MDGNDKKEEQVQRKSELLSYIFLMGLERTIPQEHIPNQFSFNTHYTQQNRENPEGKSTEKQILLVFVVLKVMQCERKIKKPASNGHNSERLQMGQCYKGEKGGNGRKLLEKPHVREK